LLKKEIRDEMEKQNDAAVEERNTP